MGAPFAYDPNGVMLSHERFEELTLKEKKLAAAEAALVIADDEDSTDWQRGWRGCTRRIREAIDDAS